MALMLLQVLLELAELLEQVDRPVLLEQLFQPVSLAHLGCFEVLEQVDFQMGLLQAV